MEYVLTESTSIGRILERERLGRSVSTLCVFYVFGAGSVQVSSPHAAHLALSLLCCMSFYSIGKVWCILVLCA